jgi:glycosyltransferase involved in cell wall biosynthesis
MSRGIIFEAKSGVTLAFAAVIGILIVGLYAITIGRYASPWMGDAAKYIEATRSFLRGELLLIRSADGAWPISLWPPGYPVVGAAVSWFGLPPPQALLLVTRLSVAACVPALTWALLTNLRPTLAVLAAVLGVMAPGLVSNANLASSDAVFCLMAVLATGCMARERWLLAGMFISLGFCLRNAAFALGAAAAVAAVLEDGQTCRSRLRRLLLLTAGAAPGMISLSLWNLLALGTGSGRAIRVLVLPSARSTKASSGDAPNPTKLFDHLARLGVQMDALEPLPSPWNPFAGKHGLMQGVDILRTLYVLLFCRKYDAVMAINESPCALLALLRRLFRFRPAILAVDVAFVAGWQTRDLFLKTLLPRLDGLITLDESHKAYIDRQWQCPAWIETAPLQIDTDFFRPANWAGSGPVLTVGDDFGRDYATLLKAIEGLNNNLSLVAKTARLPASVKHDPRLTIIPHRIGWQELRSLYEAARFVVIPLSASIHASGVSTLLEAMAMGKAVVVAASPGISGYVIPGETALVVPPGDAVALRAAIEQLRSDDALCRRLGAAARLFVMQRSSYGAVASRLAQVFRGHLR